MGRSCSRIKRIFPQFQIGMALMRFIPLNFGKIDPGGCDVCCSKWFAPKTNSEAKINPQFQAGFIGIGYHEKKVNCSVNH